MGFEFTTAFNRLIEFSCEQIGCASDTGRSAFECISSFKINYFTSHSAYISVYLLPVTSSAEALIVCLGVIQLPGGRQNGVKVFTGLCVCEINKRDGERDSESRPRGA